MAKTNRIALRVVLASAVSLFLACQPMITAALSVPVAEAQDSTGDQVGSAVSFAEEDASIEDIKPNNAAGTADSLFDLDWVVPATNTLQLSPQDSNALAEDKVDVRVTDYLLTMVKPVEEGGYNLGPIKVERLTKNYSTDGIGRFDREGLDALEEDPSVVSAHHDGKATDISEIGEVTCKLVKKRHLGGSTTTWLPARPVKVAWQSRDGISRFPTPTGDSLVGTAGAMSAQSIIQYLNESGEMDAYVDYVKGLNFEDIALYVGMNILLKNYIPSQIKNDPLAMSAIEAFGAQALHKTLPGLPEGSFTAEPNEDVRLRVAKARLEESLGLPAGSLAGFGWKTIMQGTGKRVIERELGLPTLYLDTHSLEDLTALESVQAALEYAGRTDDSFNVINGTIEAIKNHDDKGLLMASVKALSLAFKLTPAQREALAKVTDKSNDSTLDPGIDTSSLPVTNSVSLSSLEGLFSNDREKQRAAEAEFRTVGLTLLRESVAKAVPSTYTGVTRNLLEDLINKQTVNVGELLTQIGAARLGAEVGLSAEAVESALRQPRQSQNAELIAKQFNDDLGLTGSSAISATDIQQMLKRGQTTVAKKIAGAQLDRAMKWNDGSALAVINGEKKFEDAMKESMANAIAEMLGLTGRNYTLNGDTGRLFAAAAIEQRLGLPKGTIIIDKNPSAEELLRQIGATKASEIFGVNLSEPGLTLDKPSVVEKLASWDAILGVEKGTLRTYLGGNLGFDAFVTRVRDSSFLAVTAGKIWDYYGLDERYRITDDEVTNLVAVIKGGKDVDVTKREAAIQSVYRLLGRTVESKTGFNLDSFINYIVSPDKKAAGKLLLDQGLSLFAQSIGINVPNVTVETLQQTAVQIKAMFDGDSTLERARQELAVLEAKGNRRTEAENSRYRDLSQDRALALYRGGFDQLTNFFLTATGIPNEFRADAASFLAGDFRSGLNSMSFVLWMKAVNPYLPVDANLTYQSFRDTVVFDDEGRINARIDKIVDETDVKDAEQQRENFRNQARRELMEEARKNVEYRISDGFLRKADPTIPVGFTATIFSNDERAKAELFERWVFSKLDALLLGADNSYTTGTIEALYRGTTDQKKAVLVREIARRSGISLGPIGGENLALYVDYLTTPSGQRGNLLTDVRYGAMWHSVDNWLSEVGGFGELPTGTAQSLYLASQNGWDFNKEIKDANGNVTVASLNSLGENFMLGKVSLWGDKTLGLPSGTVIRTYQAIQNVATASKALHAARAAGDLAKVAQSAKALSAAQASLTLLVITTALNACSACQQLFNTVDQAIAAPPGFTNAAVAGAIAMALGLGPMGLYIAAAIYLFGVYKVEYLCPVPPKDPYSLPAYDQDYDRIDYGYPYDPKSGAIVKSSPKLGENPFDWDDDVPFADGNDPQLWMGWSRFFAGRLLDKTLEYGASQDSAGQPRQVITFRQANVEFFADRSSEAFGEIEEDNPKVGMGFTQTSTKTTDWVHVSFGGLF